MRERRAGAAIDGNNNASHEASSSSPVDRRGARCNVEPNRHLTKPRSLISHCAWMPMLQTSPKGLESRDAKPGQWEIQRSGPLILVPMVLSRGISI